MKLEPRYLVIAALAHVLLIVLLVAVVDMSHLKLDGEKKQNAIEMRLADGPVVTTTERLQAEAKRKQAEEKKRREAELAAKRKAEAEQKAKAEAEQKRKAEQEAKKKREAEEAARKRKAEAERKKKAEAEKKRKQELEKKKAAEAKRQAEEKKRKEEEARKKAAAEKKRQQELARKKAAEEAERKRKAAEAKALQDAMAQEMAAEEAARAQREIATAQSRYAKLLSAHIKRYWTRPPSGPDNFQCEVAVSQMASGEVIDVQISRSCGSVALDESVRKAVLRSSPLPKPDDPRAFAKNLNLIFKPR